MKKKKVVAPMFGEEWGNSLEMIHLEISLLVGVI